MRYKDVNPAVYHLYHGSPYDNITKFKIEGLLNRTGTPGTLSFSTTVETARFYGNNIYRVAISGHFGDYLSESDIKSNFEWRWPRQKDFLYKRWQAIETKESFEILSERVQARMLKELKEGLYAMWENTGLWNALQWDGAWCYESSRNLIVGNPDTIKQIIEVKKLQ